MPTYESENWTMNRSDKRKIESAEMRFLRPGAGYSFLHQNRNGDLYSELKVFSLTKRIATHKENSYEHILRVTTDRLPKILLNYKTRRHRSI
jgi:hypothetical protein